MEEEDQITHLLRLVGRVLMGVPNYQLTTNFSANCQLTTNFSYLLTFYYLIAIIIDS